MKSPCEKNQNSHLIHLNVQTKKRKWQAHNLYLTICHDISVTTARKYFGLLISVLILCQLPLMSWDT